MIAEPGKTFEMTKCPAHGVQNMWEHGCTTVADLSCLEKTRLMLTVTATTSSCFAALAATCCTMPWQPALSNATEDTQAAFKGTGLRGTDSMSQIS